MRKFNLSDVLSLIKGAYKISGRTDGIYFTNIKPVLEAEKDSLVFVSADRTDKMDLIRQTRAQVVICDITIVPAEDLLESKCLIQVEDPKLVFARIGNALFKELPSYGTHPTAVIHPEAKVHKNTYIGPFTYIGKCVIGEGTIIYGHVYLYDNTNIGKNVIIHAGCVLGSDGLGHIRNENEEYEQFPHIGGVIIEDDVEICGNTVVERGALGNTIIRKGAKIDNLVLVGHNVVVGLHTGIAANTMIAGTTIIGDYSYIAPCCVIRDYIKIGSHVFIGLGSTVTKDVPDAETWVGSPAQPLSKFILREKKLKEIMEDM
jgi:UDP-3-O-[3-hydroxymyristoyl] glucosamine N-acyltransferase